MHSTVCSEEESKCYCDPSLGDIYQLHNEMLWSEKSSCPTIDVIYIHITHTTISHFINFKFFWIRKTMIIPKKRFQRIFFNPFIYLKMSTSHAFSLVGKTQKISQNKKQHFCLDPQRDHNEIIKVFVIVLNVILI